MVNSISRFSGSLDLFGSPPPAPRRPGRKPHVPTPGQRKEIRHLRTEGLSIEAIAKRVGLHRNTLFRHYANEIGSPSQAGSRLAGSPQPSGPPMRRGRPRHAPTDEQRAAISEMAGQGASLAEMARATGVSPATIQRRYPSELANWLKD